MKNIANIRVGKPDVAPDAPAHTPGVRQGNEPGSMDRDPGLQTIQGPEHAGNIGKGTARRSTGVNPRAKNPIDPSSPNLSPA
jgi:hypothetical protein